MDKEHSSSIQGVEKTVHYDETKSNQVYGESNRTGLFFLKHRKSDYLESVTTTIVTQPATESDGLFVTFKPYPYGDMTSCSNSWRPGLAVLFQHWVTMAAKHKIDYVIFYGSLLGALRNGDLIPWDSDIDVLLDVKYGRKMKSLAPPRNFDDSDGKIRLVVQSDSLKEETPPTIRKRYTCYGEVR